MYVCNYCGRNLKKEYEECPGCGATSFNKTEEFGQKVIETPPEGGYIINVESYNKEKKMAKIFKWVGIIIIVFIILFDIPFILGGVLSMTVGGDTAFGLSFILIPLTAGLVFIAMGLGFFIGGKKFQKRADENIKRVTKLSKEGLLIKNLKYELVPSGTYVNDQPIYCLKVNYQPRDGKSIPLVSNAKFDKVLTDNNGTADLLIDKNDPSNYYIDLEIY